MGIEVNKKSLLIICLTTIIGLILYSKVQAVVTGGSCVDCHTMHNSQDGQPMAYQVNTSFTGFEPRTTTDNFLLVSDCVGCHTSTGSSTIVNNVPIVFSTSSFSNPLAGGNFSSVRNNDFRGHNVVGIITQDSTLVLVPPGGTEMSSQLNCAGEFGCHGDRSAGKDNYTALKGAHHTDDSGGITGSSVGLSYRFLEGILGKEDNDWEQDNTSTSHNEYQGSTSSATDTISYICSKCHGKYHTWVGGSTEVGNSSPWLRHPTDISLKASGEYANYTDYSMVAPVARPDPDSVAVTSQVTPGTDIIMCLSCHRAHASPHYKILRWDYKSSTLSTALSGCNVCHTSKD
jgi:hypothetical protein